MLLQVLIMPLRLVFNLMLLVVRQLHWVDMQQPLLNVRLRLVQHLKQAVRPLLLVVHRLMLLV